jgi:glucose-6-phosphate 1-dehydrogenase
MSTDTTSSTSSPAARIAEDPHAIIIFGASGDLAKVKLLPALYELVREKLLPEKFFLLGYARTKMTDEEFRTIAKAAIAKHSRSAKKHGVDQAVLNKLLACTYYQAGQYGAVEDFNALGKRLAELESKHATQGNRLFYMSTPPEAFEPIILGLGKASLVKRHATTPWQRLIIEKPFGTDLASAQKLNGTLNIVFGEEQIFRIDHYLGKETVQNLAVLRFANSVFEPIWNYKYIDHVQITVGEIFSADDRGGYYDKSGALRDMVQNHIFQLMALVAMEAPAALDARSIRDEKTKVYKSIRPVSPANVVRGQYAAGKLANSTPTTGYLTAKGVAPDSKTETFVALKLFIDNWRWSGTPFYIRTGKCMPAKISEVLVRFREPPRALFLKQDLWVYSNELVIRVAPEEGISWHINGKVPGGAMNIKRVAMSFDYADTFKAEPPEAYERLLHDAITGDQTLFIRGDEAEAAWEVIDPIEQFWSKSSEKPHQYAPNSWGPEAANKLFGDLACWTTSLDDAQPINACALPEVKQS